MAGSFSRYAPVLYNTLNFRSEMEVESKARSARVAGQKLAQTPLESRNRVLYAIAEALVAHNAEIAAANAADLISADAAGLDYAVRKRLVLDPPKLSSLVDGLRQLIAQPDPIGVVGMHRQLADGLTMRRVSCPIGVLCIIFEARPEAVIQIASLAIKSGNALILKGGKEAQRSNEALVNIVRAAITSVAAAEAGAGSRREACVPEDAVQLVSSREDVAELLKLDTLIDVRAQQCSHFACEAIAASHVHENVRFDFHTPFFM